ncbi:hypothetical protein [Moorena producens]|uniref:hypothetical protein n=1 Tax=Moorena producens TaxID=1155739 RepID=UPI00143A8ED5|nr:hypothetical protein [Moorena producens]
MRYKFLGFREQGTENREQGTGNREQGTGKKSCVPDSYEKRCRFTSNLIVSIGFY